MSGCDGFRAPNISVGDVALIDATDEALALSFVMDLDNPNTAAVPLREFRYTLAIDGKEVYAGRRHGGVTLSAVDSRQVSLPAIVPYQALGWTSQTLPASIDYTITGQLQYYAPRRLTQVLFDTGTRRPKIPFSSRGTLKLRREPIEESH
jgi:LEA14-like dessication related protein